MYPSQILQRNIKLRFEEILLPSLEEMIQKIPHFINLLELPENQPLIRSECRMSLENIYSPQIDVAVGPYSFREGSLDEIYYHFFKLPIIDRFVEVLNQNSLGMGYNRPDFEVNQNPRCFIAVEVENTTASDIKHLLGSVANCSFLAKIGIVVVFDEHLDCVKRLIQYLDFVRRKKKFDIPLFRNVFIISKSRIEEILGINNNIETDF